MADVDENPFIQKPTIDKGKGGVLIDFIQTIVIALAIVVVIYLFIAIPNQVDGQSMEPNFFHNELLLTNKIIQFVGGTSLGERFDYNYKRGDVIIFQKPGHPDFIKRIIAVEGDLVSLEDGQVVVNGKIIDEKYIDEPTLGGTFLDDGDPPIRVKDAKDTPQIDSYFVMGDNRDNSRDSRFAEIAVIDRRDIKGKVFLRYWPLNKFGLIQTGEFEELDRVP